MLRNEFVEGTGDIDCPRSKRSWIYCKPGDVGVYVTGIKQFPTGEFEKAYVFVGTPASEDYITEFRKKRALGKNWGVVNIPKDCLEGINVKNSRGIVEEQADGFLVAGILLNENVRKGDARRFLSDEHEVVFASPRDFSGLNLES